MRRERESETYLCVACILCIFSSRSWHMLILSCSSRLSRVTSFSDLTWFCFSWGISLLQWGHFVIWAGVRRRSPETATSCYRKIPQTREDVSVLWLYFFCDNFISLLIGNNQFVKTNYLHPCWYKTLTIRYYGSWREIFGNTMQNTQKFLTCK